jgi:hypothetical protein
MPSDTVWVAAIASSGALLGSGIGYLTSLAQRHVELRRLDADERAAVRDIEGKAREERRTLYLSYLARVDALRPMLVNGQPSQVELLEWWESYLDLDRQLDLVAHHRVFSVTGPLWTI